MNGIYGLLQAALLLFVAHVNGYPSERANNGFTLDAETVQALQVRGATTLGDFAAAAGITLAPTLTEDEKALLSSGQMPAGNWTPPADTPIIFHNFTEGSNDQLVPRAGNPKFTAYTGVQCTGGFTASAAGFGCGGTCHAWSPKAKSALLQMDNKFKPKATASMYFDTLCGSQSAGAHESIGIWAGKTQGCTDASDDTMLWQSGYLYYGCR
ncbi:hypothetical protein N431DRAFT_445243 [Stipitochalara longipes BDJ]|nr:hypothetical protein N431DRAFT_445243 [Stipitochalara longipes BDJ]